MNQKERAEALYRRISDVGAVTGLEIVSPEHLRPNPGTLLVVLPPVQTKTKGGIELPDQSQKPPLIAQVLSIPEDDLDCSVVPGDWVLYRAGHLQELPLAEHRNLGYLQYSNDAMSEVLFSISEENMNADIANAVVTDDRWRSKAKLMPCETEKLQSVTV